MWLKIYISEPGPRVSLTLKSADWRQAKSRAMTKLSMLWEVSTGYLRQKITIRWFIASICRLSSKRMGLTHTIDEEIFSISWHRVRHTAVCEVDSSIFPLFFIQRVRTHHLQNWWQDLHSNIYQAKTAHTTPATGWFRGFCWNQAVVVLKENGNKEVDFGIGLPALDFGMDKRENGGMEASMYLYQAV